MLGSWIRRTGFWTLDRLSGGITRKHYNDIKCRMNKKTSNDEQIEQLLKHAVESTPYYKQRIKEAPLLKIENFPIITKYDIKKNYGEFQSERYLNKKIHHMSTSGSTGTPFTVNQDMNKRKRVLAEIIYFNELGKQKLGDKYIYFRVWNDKTRKSKLESIMQNLIPVDISKLDKSFLISTTQMLKKNKKIVSALAYASTYKVLARYLQNEGAVSSEFNIKSLFSSSEILDSKSKEILCNVLGCEVYDRYSNQENGIIAQTRNNSDIFYVNTPSYYVELLKVDSNEPASKGELARIIITDLYNYAMPLIRYDTGDLAIKIEESSKAQIRFKTVQGRSSDLVYDTNGNQLTPLTLYFCIWKFEKIMQFQLIQKSAFEYRIKINGGQNAYEHAEIIKEFKKALGDKANITLEFVHEIPQLSSGKFKDTISQYEYDESNYL
ncbi:MAG: phenylacetate--CoA ligase family protein [Syntrophomonadaceae bacterium]|nr:phenylacetate--CoA ligase family protein [Syntrophomonadaceae bacterium]